MTIDAPRDVAIATVTLVREPQEEPLLRRSMLSLSRLGLPVFVSDGGSPDAFVSTLRALPNVTAVDPAGTGLVGQVRGSLGAAARSGVRLVLYTECDKEAFFADGARALAERAQGEDALGVVLAGRSDAAFQSFPPTQRIGEEAINQLCERLLLQQGDYSYGPFAMRSSLIAYLQRASDDLGWGWRPFIFAIAHRLGQRIVHVSGDHACPADQRNEDERDRLHRLRQLRQNVLGLEAAMVLDLSTLPSD